MRKHVRDATETHGGHGLNAAYLGDCPLHLRAVLAHRTRDRPGTEQDRRSARRARARTLVP